jgi:hypothetical protein
MGKCSGLPNGYAQGGEYGEYGGYGGTRPPVKGLPYAVRNISVQLSAAVEEWVAILRASVWTVLVPAFTVLLVVTLVATVVWRVRKRLCPTVAAEQHRQALLLLMKQEQQQVQRVQVQVQQSVGSKIKQPDQQQLQQQQQQQLKQQYQQVLALLTNALQQDPTYLPARLSLAALYVYRLNDGHAALRVLQELTALTTKTTTTATTTTEEEEHGDGDGAAQVPTQTQAQVRGLTLDAQAVIAGQGHMVQGMLQEDWYLRTSILSPPATPTKQSSSSSSSSKQRWWWWCFAHDDNDNNNCSSRTSDKKKGTNQNIDGNSKRKTQ